MIQSISDHVVYRRLMIHAPEFVFVLLCKMRFKMTDLWINRVIGSNYWIVACYRKTLLKCPSGCIRCERDFLGVLIKL